MHNNESDLLTKLIPKGNKRTGFFPKHSLSYIWLLGQRKLVESEKVWAIQIKWSK